ncbi:MAG TPA: hypothetical protein VK812_06820 [Candidatus Binatus sp.]|jgi:hypothetical protein|nr:hypothetical protein [Candidatus Binatus sp.]
MQGKIFALGLLLLITPIASAKDRTLVAEGDYIARTKTGDNPLSHWQLWHLSNGGYEVVDTSIKNASSVQIFRFDSQFFPIGYIKKLGPISKPQASNVATLPGWTISCRYESKKLSCDAESSEGRKSTTSIAAEDPYVVTGEFYDLDFTWFMTGVVRLALRNGAKDGVVNTYALTDGAKAGDIGLEPDDPMKIVFTGEETTQVMGKMQVVKKYEWGSEDFPLLRVTSQGLVVSLTNRSDPAIGLEMSGYKEYEPWGPIR